MGLAQAGLGVTSRQIPTPEAHNVEDFAASFPESLPEFQRMFPDDDD